MLLRRLGRRVEIEFTYEAEGARGKQRIVKRAHPFEGILPNLERRFRETDSAAVREDLVAPTERQALPRLPRHAAARRGAQRLPGRRRERRARSRSSGSSTSRCATALAWFEAAARSPARKAEIADKVVREICSRLKFLNDVGLNYLSLDRSAETLSGGEAQRIRLASQIGSGLTGVMYVLDEPSIGLHQRDNERLIGTLFHLRDIGNSVIVVEHDEDAIRAADHVHRHGPGRRRARRPGDGRRARPTTSPRRPIRSPAATCRARCASPMPKRRAPAAATRTQWLRIARRARQQPEERRRRHPGRPASPA